VPTNSSAQVSEFSQANETLFSTPFLHTPPISYITLSILCQNTQFSQHDILHTQRPHHPKIIKIHPPVPAQSSSLLSPLNFHYIFANRSPKHSNFSTQHTPYQATSPSKFYGIPSIRFNLAVITSHLAELELQQ
jgi:hypothetical protein